jgi:predicted RNA-binding protein (virulence factor B family)
MVKIGRYNKLEVIKFVEFGAYLDGEDLGEILLPNRYIPKDCKVYDFVEIFLYKDSEDRLIATTEKPYAQVNEFGYLEVVANGNYGAFVDWGLPKDLLIPYSQQKTDLLVGRKYLVFVYFDKKTNRIAGTTKIEEFVLDYDNDFRVGDEVEIITTEKTNYGYKVIVDNLVWGIIFDTEINTQMYVGKKTKGFIKEIRKDGIVHVILELNVQYKFDRQTQRILNHLKKNNNYLAINDKSSPQKISDLFGFSKNIFKQSVGILYRHQIIEIDDDGIKLIKPID